MSGKMMIDKSIVALVEQRAGDYCEVCGLPAQEGMALHHRKLKSRGGKDTVSNLIRVHHGCHNLNTNSIHANPSWAEDKGYMVPSWKDPEEHPIFRPNGAIVLLKNDGSLITLQGGNNE